VTDTDRAKGAQNWASDGSDSMRIKRKEDRRVVRPSAVYVAMGMAVLLPVAAMANTLGDRLWNYRENAEDFFGANDSWVRPWETIVDDGYGMFQGGHNGYFLWHAMGVTGNSLDGSLSLDRPRDHQFHVWTYLYAPTARTISLDGTGDCVPRWFLNYAFDSPRTFPDGAPATISLVAGWNRLDITGYNQYDSFIFDSGPLANQVSIMNTLPVPEPSVLAMVVAISCLGGVTLLARPRFDRRRGL
jgi:hypothetical protein